MKRGDGVGGGHKEGEVSLGGTKELVFEEPEMYPVGMMICMTCICLVSMHLGMCMYVCSICIFACTH